MKDERERELDLGCKKVKLSIIIPIYNMEAYLKRCLDSVKAAVEKLSDVVEVLLINDGSTDSSEKIALEYCEVCKYMHLYNKTNGGVSDVKNYGLERASGEYIIFLDSDDYIDPRMYELMLTKAAEEKADVVVCDIQLTYDDTSKNTVFPCAIKSREGVFAQVIDMTMMPASWNKLVRRELYDGLTFPAGKNNEDVAVTPIILARAKKIAVVDEVLYMYYQRSGSIQNSSFNEKRFVILETARLCVDRIEKEHIELRKEEQIKGSVYLHQVLSLALYPIRREKFSVRYRMLKNYMPKVESLFPDIWDNFEIKEFVTWDTKWIQISRKISIFLLKKNLYLLLSVFWSPCNWLYDLQMKVYAFYKNR